MDAKVEKKPPKVKPANRTGTVLFVRVKDETRAAIDGIAARERRPIGMVTEILLADAIRRLGMGYLQHLIEQQELDSKPAKRSNGRAK